MDYWVCDLYPEKLYKPCHGIAPGVEQQGQHGATVSPLLLVQGLPAEQGHPCTLGPCAPEGKHKGLVEGNPRGVREPAPLRSLWCPGKAGRRHCSGAAGTGETRMVCKTEASDKNSGVARKSSERGRCTEQSQALEDEPVLGVEGCGCQEAHPQGGSRVNRAGCW